MATKYIKKDCPYGCKNIHTVVKLTKNRFKCPSCLKIFVHGKFKKIIKPITNQIQRRK